MRNLGLGIGVFLGLGLAVLLAVEWMRWRSKRRAEGVEAYPGRRFGRRAASVLLLEMVLALIMCAELQNLQSAGPMRQLVVLGPALAMSFGALLLALGDLRDVRRRLTGASEAVRNQAMARLEQTLRERGCDPNGAGTPGGSEVQGDSER